MRKLARGPLSKLLLVLALLAPVTGLSASPASAALGDVARGDITFAGVLSLPRFPCQQPPPFGNGPCTGLYKAAWSGQLAGVWNAMPFDVTWKTPDLDPALFKMHTAFQYSESFCTVSEAGLVSGFGSGSGTATAGTNEVVGFIENTLTGVPALITEVSMGISFSWTREGNGIQLLAKPVTITLRSTVGTHTVVDVNNLEPALFAAGDFFLSEPVPPPTYVPTCNNPWYGVKALMNGHMGVDWADVS